MLVAVLVAGPPAAAARGGERPPNPEACVHNDPAIARLTAQEAARPTWPEQRLQFSRAWAFAQGAGVTVAVVDSGVDASHEQLAGQVVAGWDVTGGKAVKGGTSDCAGHGTAVAGLIAASPVAGRAMVGVAPGARILPVRESWGIDSHGHATVSTAETLIEAIRVAVDSGAQVVNVSVTVPDTQLREPQRQAFGDLARYAFGRNVLIVAATGNRSQYPDLRGQEFATYPARLAAQFRNVIAVSGITSDGKVDADAVTGPFVTVAAPDRGFPSTMEHGGLVSVAGTSYAAPLVSGMAALVRSRYPELSAAQVRVRIEATADRPSTDLPNPQVGYGVINPLAAVTAVLPPVSSPVALPTGAPPLDVVTPKDAALKARALGSAAVAVLVAGLLLSGALVVRRGRRRGWRPGRSPLAGTRSGPAARLGG
jgi:type VII secretion-associated serine protease mycosin